MKLSSDMVVNRIAFSKNIEAGLDQQGKSHTPQKVKIENVVMNANTASDAFP